MILSGTYRAIFESAKIEGDPSIFGLKSIFWYFPYLDDQFGGIIIFFGFLGILFILFENIRFFKLPFRLEAFLSDKNYKWNWVFFNLITCWTFTTFMPNKDERYISCAIPSG